MGAGWLLTRPLSKPTYEPAHWRYADSRSALDAAGGLIATDLAERRNMLLLNPVASDSSTAEHLITAYQMVLPGERARSHRHTASALRLVLDAGPGMYTIVDGTRLDMHPGDVVLTPNWCWHGHANDGTAPAYWIDYLDSPLVLKLQRWLFEPHPQAFEAGSTVAAASPFVYSWTDTHVALREAPLDESRHFERRVQLNRYPMKTIGLEMCAVGSSGETREFTVPSSCIYTVVEGEGRSAIAGRTFDWTRGDVFVAPAGMPQRHDSSRAVLLCVNDAPWVAALQNVDL